MTAPQPGQPYQPLATDPFDAPIRGVSFGGAVRRFFAKYARFSGRASLSEFWWMFLWSIIVGIVISVVALAVILPSIFELAASGALDTETEQTSLATNAAIWSVIGRFAGIWIVVVLIELALVIPWLAMTVRRLHDSNKSGHLAWLLLVPSVGHLIVLILCLMPSEAYGQRFDRPLAAR